MSTNMPPRPSSTIIKANPYSGLGFCCVMHELLPTQLGKSLALESGLSLLTGRPMLTQGDIDPFSSMPERTITWEEACEFYRHTDAVWQKALTMVMNGASANETYRTLLIAGEIGDFTESQLESVTAQVRYWRNPTL